MSEFGCAGCFGEDAKASWDHVSHGQGARQKIAGDYAFEVRVTRCPSCAQAFLFIQNEGITWDDGPSFWYETALPVTDVCLAVGFSSLGSFSTLFRRHAGVSPQAYRAQK